MIKIRIKKNGVNYQKISILGHAMYDRYGKDIVCSAVSSIVITTINGILSINKDSLSYLVSNKGMSITISGTDRVTQILIRNMINLLKELENDYPENIQFK